MQFLSDRVMHMRESATISMNKLSQQMKAQGEHIINLSLGEPNFPTPDYICEAAIEAIKSGKYFSYPPVSGYTDVKEVIAEKFSKENGINSSAAHIVISTGAKQSIANVIISTVNPGDEVVISQPYWVSYPSLVKFVGGKPIYAETDINKGYKLQAEALEKALSPRTKLFIFSSPSNPTGAVLSAAELEDLNEVLVNYPNVLILSDEIYEYINFSGHHASIGSIDSLAQRTITVNGLSKGFAMTGWRIGYIHAPQPIARACEKVQGQFTSATNSIAQRTILSALQQPKKSSELMCKAYHKRSQRVHELLSQIPGIKSYLPEGAYYMFPDVSDYLFKKAGTRAIDTVHDLCIYLLEEAKVSTVSGSAFGGDKCIRFSFGASEELLEEAIARIKKALAQLS